MVDGGGATTEYHADIEARRRRRTTGRFVLNLIALAVVLAGCSSAPEEKRAAPLPLEQQPLRARASVDDAIRDGVAFLLKTQNKKGYWGTCAKPLGWDIYAHMPGSQGAFRSATTGLCAMALREIGTPESLAAAIRAEDWLAAEGIEKARRDTADEIYCVWGHAYGLQALAVAIQAEKDPARKEALSAAARQCVDMLKRYETTWGGWNYYDFAYLTRTPSMEPTSFGTAATLVALKEAKAAGIEVPDLLVKRAVRVLERCRSPKNTFLYSYDWRYYPMGYINRPAGSLGRTQVCNYALYQCKSPTVTMEHLTGGLERLFKEQHWLEIGRKRPYPHESWYAVAGYFYYFGHYYAARMFALIPAEAASAFAQLMSDTIRPKQEEDGSWWDFGMWDFHKPYGTAYALMILKRCRDFRQ